MTPPMQKVQQHASITAARACPSMFMETRRNKSHVGQRPSVMFGVDLRVVGEGVVRWSARE